MTSTPTYEHLLTTENIIRNYQLLSCEDSEQRQRANRFLLTLPDYEQTWACCKNMIQQSTDTNFVLLGAQLLYQKIEKDLHQFEPTFKIQLKNFIFEELDSGKHTKTFVLDKLASSAALIVSSLYLNEWPNFIQDLTQFMKKSSNHLLCGLIVLERIPQELRMTNRIPQGVKSKIQEKFLQHQPLFTLVFDSVFDLKDQACIRAVLKTIESWIRICYPLIKYPNLVTKVLENSLQNFQKLQIGIKVICEAVKLVSEQKSPGLSSIDLAKEQQAYTPAEIQSLQTVIAYVMENKKNFLSSASTQPEYTEMYLQLIKQILLSFGFLILQNLGFELLNIMKEIIQSRDLKLSYSTFEFWIDYSQKVSRLKLSIQVKEKVWNEFQSLLQVFSQKLVIVNDTMMIQADLKDDETGDDVDGMSFTEYRKEAANLLRSIYDYFVKVNKEQGAEAYFKKVVALLQADNPPLGRYTQLALFLLKSPLESMINVWETAHIIEILEYIITKINTQNTMVQPIPPIVLGQTMNFIRDCTREIKQKDQLFLQALKFVLNYINDEKLCHHAAYCFQILMQTINTLNQPIIAQSLIQFYSQKKFSKQVVLQKMLQGIFNAIIKVPDLNKVQNYLDSILNTLLKKYHLCSKSISLDQENRSELYLSLVEIKTVLDSYDSSNSGFKGMYKGKFLQLANKSVEIVNEILPLGIKNRLKFSVINEVGLAISIYRVALKILEVPENFAFINQTTPSYILSLNIPLTILTQQDILQYYYTINIFSQTLIQFINHTSPYLDNWLQGNLPYFNAFFLQHYQTCPKIDPDVVKVFINVQEGVILYNRNVFFACGEKESVLKVALHAVRNLNERNMQRKIVGFINLGLENQVWANTNYESILQEVFASIPIIHSMCYTNLAKIFKYLFKNTTLQSKQSIFTGLLSMNPYLEIDQNLRQLLAKAITWALLTEEERNIKTFFVQLNEIVWKKVSSDILMQLELKIATWKRQHKKLIQQQQQQALNNVQQ